MDRMQLEDRVRRAAAGSSDAFAELCVHKGKDIIYLCAKNMGSLHDGEDAAQEVFIRMQSSIQNLKQPEAFNSWLYRLIHNTCTDIRRKRMKEKYDKPLDTLDDSALLESQTDFIPQDFVEDEDKRRRLMQYIDGLSRNLRMCVILYYYEEMSCEEIAEALDTSEGTVKQNLMRARRQLRDAIEEQQPGAYSNELLPMSAITTLLQQEAAAVTTDMVAVCLQQAAIAAGTLSAAGVKGIAAAASGLSKLALAAIGGVLAVGVSVACWVGISQDSNPAQQVLSSPGISQTDSFGDPQRQGSVSDATDGREDIVPVEGTPDAGISLSAEAVSEISDAPGGGGMATEEEAHWNDAPSGTDVGGARVKGQVVFIDKDGGVSDGATAYAEGMRVLLWRGDAVLGEGMVDAAGEYSIDTPALSKAEKCVLRLYPAYTPGVEPVWQNGAEQLEVKLMPGQAIIAPDLCITDNIEPLISVRLTDDEGGYCVYGPTFAQVVISDATQTMCRWSLTTAAGDVLDSGEAQPENGQVEISLAAGQAGSYVLVLEASDAAGNESVYTRRYRAG